MKTVYIHRGINKGQYDKKHNFCIIDINECASFPCQNYGICMDQVNGYNFACAPGYAGSNCEFGKEKN